MIFKNTQEPTLHLHKPSVKTKYTTIKKCNTEGMLYMCAH